MVLTTQLVAVLAAAFCLADSAKVRKPVRCSPPMKSRIASYVQHRSDIFRRLRVGLRSSSCRPPGPLWREADAGLSQSLDQCLLDRP